jgi:hypothetical protein
MTISAELLAAAKNYLDITWTDEAADLKLTGQLKRGIDYIISKTGVDSSAFEVEGREQELLFNYVLYDRSGSVDQFKVNYRSDLIGLRMRQEVENYAATSEA